MHEQNGTVPGALDDAAVRAAVPGQRRTGEAAEELPLSADRAFGACVAPAVVREVAVGIDFSDVRVVDLAPLRQSADPSRVAADIARACRESGFFYVVGHGVDEALQARLDAAARRFFARPAAVKMDIAMARGGRAWRGYFPVGGELTSGKPDLKEGLYFGRELGADDPRVRAGMPLHGANLFPDDMPEPARRGARVHGRA